MKKSMKNMIAALTAVILCVVLDQYTKALAVTNLQGNAPFVLIDGVLEFNYTINEGMAFSLLQQQQVLFYIMTAVIVGAVTYLYLFRIPNTRKYLPLDVVIIMLVGGAIGNLIDRVRLKYVVDFIYFKLIDFPVFNVADCFVTVSCALFFLLILFRYKEEDLKEII